MANYKKGTPEYKAYKQGKKGQKNKHPLGPTGALIKGGVADLLIKSLMKNEKKA